MLAFLEKMFLKQGVTKNTFEVTFFWLVSTYQMGTSWKQNVIKRKFPKGEYCPSYTVGQDIYRSQHLNTIRITFYSVFYFSKNKGNLLLQVVLSALTSDDFKRRLGKFIEDKDVSESQLQGCLLQYVQLLETASSAIIVMACLLAFCWHLHRSKNCIRQTFDLMIYTFCSLQFQTVILVSNLAAVLCIS